ncbi:hypothetical protein BD410DRAFT_751554, partial [Rickenella mellea]
MFPKKEGERNATQDNGTSAIPSDLPDLTEPSSRIWEPYLKLAEKYDKDLVESWRDDMESLLIFAALFSASVTAFVIESYQALQQDTGQATLAVLLRISEQLANGTISTPAVQPIFQQQSGDIAVNVLWFLSLGFSLACALAAVMVRQWARRYLRTPRSLSSISDQARMRQYLFANMEWWKMDLVVETIPILLHVSLILFMIGLLLFVHFVNFQVALSLLCFSVIGGVVYIFLTITPLISVGCPYRTPFSGLLPLSAKLFTAILTVALACLAMSIWLFLSLITIICPSMQVSKCSWALQNLQILGQTFSPWFKHFVSFLQLLHRKNIYPSYWDLKQLKTWVGQSLKISSFTS